MNPFLSLPEYEQFVYTLQQQYPAVLRSTLTIARQVRGLARLTGELHFINGYRLVISEITIRNPTQINQRWPALIRITNTFRQRSSIIVSLRLGCVLTAQIYRC